MQKLTPDGLPRLQRSRSGAVLGGVASGLAEHLRLPVLWIRVAFAVLAIASGAGVVAYALLWVFVPQAAAGTADGSVRPPSSRERRQAVGLGALGLALLLIASVLGLTGSLGWILGPLGVAAVGAAFIWREADDTRRARWRRSAAGFVTPGASAWWRLGAGVALVVGGLVVFALSQFDFAALRSVLVAVILTLVGVALITIPWWLRLVRALGTERQERIAERERAEIAAHLHDSVLQTLALIQRQSENSREVLRLARGQERELRTWLYGPAGYATGATFTTGATGSTAPPVDTQLASALATAAGEVEDTYAVKVAPVVVGDAEMNPGLGALVAAAREAMVNAAKHSGEAEISVYAEVEDGTAQVFVRDRGKGFEQDGIDPDRRGVTESIRGRMDRHGGTATIRSAPGQGTEVELSMPLDAGADKVDLRKKES